MTRTCRILLGVTATACLAWGFVTIGMLMLAAEMRRPCRCGREHDPLDECPEGPPSLTPAELTWTLDLMAPRT